MRTLKSLLRCSAPLALQHLRIKVGQRTHPFEEPQHCGSGLYKGVCHGSENIILRGP